MSSIDARYESAIAAFVIQIRQLAREELAAQLAIAVGKKAGSGRDRSGLKSFAKSARTARATSSNATRLEKGAKRSKDVIASAVEAVYKAIVKAPGSRSEQLAPLAGLRREDMADALQRLTSDKRVRRRGTRRATKYYPAAG